MKRIATVILLVLAVMTDGSGVLAQRQGGPGRLGGGQGADGRLFGRGRGAQPQGTAVIRGRVTNAATGTPVRRAQVRAIANEIRAGRLTTTDVDGLFELRDLPAGRWNVTASKGGFITQQLGQRRPFESVQPVELADGQRFTAQFALVRGAAISGRIYDEFGDPITGAVVQVLRSQMAQGRRRLAQVGRASQTDDLGAFRLFDLAPGEYYVAASLRSVSDVPDDGFTYASTYYPGTASIAEAQRISIAGGEDQSNINFVLLPVRAVRVAGTVVDSNGMPLQAMVNLVSAAQSDDGELPIGNTAGSSPDGGFVISNVVPGTYTLNVTTRFRVNASPEVASLQLTVGNSDLTGVAVVTTRGATIRGTIAADAGARAQTSAIQVFAQPLRSRTGPIPRTEVTQAGAFELNGLVGPTALRFDRLPEGWAVKSITVGTTDVTDSTFDFKGTEQLVARVVLTNRVTEITGSVKSRGATASSGSVVVFPENEAKWTFPTRHVRSTSVDRRGSFSIRTLPPGERYLAVAVDYLEQGESQDPEFLQRLKERATSFTLGDGENKTLDLTLIER